MTYKLNRSIWGTATLFVPLLSIFIAYKMSTEYWNRSMALIFAAVYVGLILLFVASGKLYIRNNQIICSVLGIKTVIRLEDIEQIILTENGYRFTALAIQKIKIVIRNTGGKGYLLSIAHMDQFIEEMKALGVPISGDVK